MAIIQKSNFCQQLEKDFITQPWNKTYVLSFEKWELFPYLFNRETWRICLWISIKTEGKPWKALCLMAKEQDLQRQE